eukprot:gene1517-1094_t
MMYGGNLVLRTAANLSSTVTSTVTSTVNTVASVAGSSRRKSTDRNHGGMLAHAKEKVALSVKCSPNKDANTTSNLSIKSGFLMKKNEQGSFQRRFVCIVPHMFLYYFENEMADSPRGIIDLELLDNITREHDVLKLSTADEHTWRSFFFQDADGDALTEWMTALIRDRYHTVVEERNAYQAMQSEMTGAIDTQSSLAKSREQQRQQLEQEVEKHRHLYLDAFNYLQISLVELGITDDEMARLSDVHKLGTELKHRIVALRDLFHRQMEENNNRFDAELQEQQAVVTELQRQLATELTARTKLEALLVAERRERQQLDQDHAQQYGNLQIDLQLAIASKDDVEAKANVLHDQKRLLVKEVKLLRKKLEENQVLLEEMKHMNSQLADTAEALRKEVEELENKGSSVAGGLVEGLMQYTNNPLADATAGSSHSTGNMSPKRATATAAATVATAAAATPTAVSTETTAAAAVTDASEATPAAEAEASSVAVDGETTATAAVEPAAAAEANDAAATSDEPSAEASGDSDSGSGSHVAPPVDEDRVNGPDANDEAAAAAAAPSEAAVADAPSAAEDAAEVDETTL